MGRETPTPPVEATSTVETVVVNLAAHARRARWQGREYIVAPMTMIVPGVMSGSKGPLLYPPEEVYREHDAWNGMPIVVYHPTAPGTNTPVSARHPEVLERQGIGHVFNARIVPLKGNPASGKLGAEGWFDVEKTRAVDPRVLHALETGLPMELSTGLFTDNEPAPQGALFNSANGPRPYSYIARNYRPDHLAVLPDRRGACNLEDGCGLMVNELVDPDLGPVITEEVLGNAFNPGQARDSAGRWTHEAVAREVLSAVHEHLADKRLGIRLNDLRQTVHARLPGTTKDQVSEVLAGLHKSHHIVLDRDSRPPAMIPPALKDAALTGKHLGYESTYTGGEHYYTSALPGRNASSPLPTFPTAQAASASVPAPVAKVAATGKTPLDVHMQKTRELVDNPPSPDVARAHVDKLARDLNKDQTLRVARWVNLGATNKKEALKKIHDRILRLNSSENPCSVADGCGVLVNELVDSDLGPVITEEPLVNGKLSGGQWITIEGRHVYIKEGKIIAGPPGLKGKSVADTGKGAAGSDKPPGVSPSVVLKSVGFVGKGPTRDEVFENPLKKSGRPYKYPGVNAIEKVKNDEKYPVTMLDPASLHSSQEHVRNSKLERIRGDIRDPIIVVRHEGKFYIEEGNHRAAKALIDGKKVPAKIIDVAEKNPNASKKPTQNIGLVTESSYFPDLDLLTANKFNSDQPRDSKGRWMPASMAKGAGRTPSVAGQSAMVHAALGKKADVSSHVSAIQTLRSRGTSVTKEEITAHVNRLGRHLNKAQVHDVARGVGVAVAKTKKDTLAAIHEHLSGQASATAPGHTPAALKPTVPDSHAELAQAVAGKQGFTGPFQRGPHAVVRHDDSGHTIEAEAGTHSGRFAVKDPSNVVHSRHDTAEEAVKALSGVQRMGTSLGTADQLSAARAAQTGKSLEAFTAGVRSAVHGGSGNLALAEHPDYQAGQRAGGEAKAARLARLGTIADTYRRVYGSHDPESGQPLDPATHVEKAVREFAEGRSDRLPNGVHGAPAGGLFRPSSNGDPVGDTMKTARGLAATTGHAVGVLQVKDAGGTVKGHALLEIPADLPNGLEYHDLRFTRLPGAIPSGSEVELLTSDRHLVRPPAKGRSALNLPREPIDTMSPESLASHIHGRRGSHT